MTNLSGKEDSAGQSERIPLKVYENAKEGAVAVAKMVSALIKEKQEADEKCVLGLATGSTPEPFYAELIRLHKEEGLSFQNVITFNLDEYYPIDPENAQSYHRFMHAQLFDQVDLPPKQFHIPDGTVPKEEIEVYCEKYEKQIEDAGGIDLQILGIGSNGHIGFNEPGSDKHSATRLITLDENTREANARNFSNPDQVPQEAITTGIGTIMKAHKIVLMAWGENKAPAIRQSVEEQATEQVPASLLQSHSDCLFVIDRQAARELNRSKS